MNSTQPNTQSVETPSHGVRLEQKPENPNFVDFDQWAIAVRQQMLDSLRKRGTRY